MSGFDPCEHLKITLNPDGTLTRHLQFPTSPATGETADCSCHTVLSKDVVLHEQNNTWLRIFRPTTIPDSSPKLPILIFFHGGGWIQFSIANSITHESCNRFSRELPAIVIATEYRLAPEHRLPAQYDDAIDTILWVQKQALNENGDPWLKNHADFSRCYLYGISCGANMAFHAALRAVDMKLDPIKINGIILNQPLFGGKQRVKSELKYATDPHFPLPVIDFLWELALPPGTDRDHRYCNPLKDESIREKVKSLGRCLVIGFGGDTIIDRQQDFVQMLVLQGVLVEARFDNVGFHLIDMIDPRRAAAILSFVKEFV